MAESIKQKEEPQLQNPQMESKQVPKSAKVREDLDIPRAREASISLRRFDAIPTDQPQEGTLSLVSNDPIHQLYTYLNGTHHLIGGTRTHIRVHMNGSAQTIENGTEQIEFDTEDFDDLNEFNTTNHNFTATQAGKYYIYAQVLVLSTVADEEYTMEIKKGSTTLASGTTDINNDDNANVVIATTQNLAVGDVIDVDITNDGTSRSISGESDDTYLEILRV